MHLGECTQLLFFKTGSAYTVVQYVCGAIIQEAFMVLRPLSGSCRKCVRDETGLGHGKTKSSGGGKLDNAE